jgi:hypothetical protein
LLHGVYGINRVIINGREVYQNIPLGILDMEQCTSTIPHNPDVKLNQEVLDHNERQRNQEGK